MRHTQLKPGINFYPWDLMTANNGKKKRNINSSFQKLMRSDFFVMGECFQLLLSLSNQMA